MAAKSILFVGSDLTLYDMLREQLELRGEYHCRAVPDLDAMLSALRDGLCDLILADEESAGDPRAALAGQGFDVALLRLVRGPASDTDALAKPFRLADLTQRLRTLIRARAQSDEADLQIGPYAFALSAKTLTDAAGRRIRLTEKETSILKYLHRADAEIVNREELLAEVWGYNSGVTTHTLETHIYRLRQKMEDDPSNAAILVTDAGGYRLLP
jgi:DNA-binding response OmpR family regulator